MRLKNKSRQSGSFKASVLFCLVSLFSFIFPVLFCYLCFSSVFLSIVSHLCELHTSVSFVICPCVYKLCSLVTVLQHFLCDSSIFFSISVYDPTCYRPEFFACHFGYLYLLFLHSCVRTFELIKQSRFFFRIRVWSLF